RVSGGPPRHRASAGRRRGGAGALIRAGLDREYGQRSERADGRSARLDLTGGCHAGAVNPIADHSRFACKVARSARRVALFPTTPFIFLSAAAASSFLLVSVSRPMRPGGPPGLNSPG